MYFERQLSVGKAENGFVVEATVPYKPRKEKEKENVIREYPGSCEKRYLAKNASEVGELIEKLMPLLEDKYTDEAEFDAAFKAATKEAK